MNPLEDKSRIPEIPEEIRSAKQDQKKQSKLEKVKSFIDKKTSRAFKKKSNVETPVHLTEEADTHEPHVHVPKKSLTRSVTGFFEQFPTSLGKSKKPSKEAKIKQESKGALKKSASVQFTGQSPEVARKPIASTPQLARKKSEPAIKIIEESSKLTREEVLAKAMDYIDWLDKRDTFPEGLFRVSAAAREVTDLLGQSKIPENISNQHLIAGAFKKTFHENPEFKIFKGNAKALLLKAADLTEKDDIISTLKNTVDTLSPEEKVFLEKFISLLGKIAKQQETTKMSPDNLGIAVGLSLVEVSNDPVSIMLEPHKISTALAKLIEHRAAIFKE